MPEFAMPQMTETPPLKTSAMPIQTSGSVTVMVTEMAM